MIKSEKVSDGGLMITADVTREELIVAVGMIIRCLLKDSSLTLAEIINAIVVSFEKEEKLAEFYKIVEATKDIKIK